MHPDIPARPLIVTDDSELLDDLLRLASAADIEVSVVHAASRAGREWPRAPLVVVGRDLVTQLAALSPGDNPNVVVTGRGTSRIDDDRAAWDSALRIGAREVVDLPDHEGRLVDLFAEAAGGGPGHAPVVAVVGGRGGAGASLLAVALALAGQRSGMRTMLIDADPLGAGLDLLIGAEHTPGARWDSFTGRQGRIIWPALRDALPTVHGIVLMTWARQEAAPVPAPAMRTILTSAVRGAELLVADLPRTPDPGTAEILGRARVALVVLTADVHSVLAAARIVPRLREQAADVRLVVRGASPATIPADTVSQSLGLPLAGVLEHEPGLARALERGDTPAQHPRSPLASFSDSFLGTLPSSPSPST
ncbi:septum site-determining protein Ssd [Nocardiopsis ansamitocini]|uniref:Septum formation initiator n=1 Tax=Nocardiopsis ansamitocini TaxID=1670832 RepID=A0A9W6P4T5_9ACTN|nr:septum site-determining protein Ssd [Nocardiopsis ansamitocini]GLU47220.1 septum formation initiator [Nocardiopsis ansamitocini]